MYLTAERRPTASDQIEKHHSTDNINDRSRGILSLAWLNTLATELKAVINPRSAFKRWDSQPYFTDRQTPFANQLQRLKVDTTTFLHEYVGMFSKKVYPYSPYGILDGYDVPTAQLCRNFESNLRAQGKDVRRASLETWVAETIEVWMEDESIPQGTKIMTISPRGTLDEGYPGEKQTNYVFINLYQKIGPHSFQLIQLTSYDTNQALSQLQAELAGVSQPYQPVALPFIPDLGRHQLITQIRQFPPTISINQIEERVYRNRKAWPIQLDKLPKLDEVNFNHQLNLILGLCVEEFTALQQLADPVQAAQEFDILMEIIREDFLKWVENHALNYQHLRTDSQLMESTLSIERIRTRWQLKKATRSLTRDEKLTLKSLENMSKLNPFGELNRLASMAHCVIGTPTSLLQKKTGAEIVQAKILNSTAQTVENLTVSEQHELHITLDALTKIYVKNRQTGETEIWYVLLTDPDQAKYYVDSCYRVDSSSPILGPCDISLYHDGFVDPNWILTEKEYWRLRQQSLSQELESALGARLTSPAEHERLRYLIQLLTQRIFRISLSNLVAGVIDFKDEGKLRLPENEYQQLLISPHPLQTLEELVCQQTVGQNQVAPLWLELVPEFTVHQAA